MSGDPAFELASACGFDPSTLRRLPHPELELDAVNGGYAFEDANGCVVVVGHDGSFGTYALYGRRPTAGQVVQEWLDGRRHARRSLVLADLGVWQQAAVAAVREHTTVAGLGLSLGAGDTDYAEWLRIRLLRFRGEPLRGLAASSELLAEPRAGVRYTHLCPLCSAPALHADRFPRSVCDDCFSRTADSEGRLVTGANVGASGGFVAHFAGTADISIEVTASKRCWVDGHPCRMDEAKFGGVVVEAL